MANGNQANSLGGVAQGLRAIAVGFNTLAKGAGSIVIGGNAKDGAVGGASDVVMGDGAESGAIINGVAGTQAGAGEAVAIGTGAKTTSWRGLALGARAFAGAVSSTAIGRGARALHMHGIALGRGAYTDRDAQVVLGFFENKPIHLHLSNGHSSRYVEPTDGGVIDRDPRLTPTTYHGMSGRDSTDTPLPNRPGGDTIVAGGESTGAAAGGAVRLQVTPAGAVSGTSENAPVDALAAYATRDVELFGGVILTSPNGTRYRLAVNDSGVLVSAVLT